MIKIIIISLTAFLLISMIFGFTMATINKEEFIGKSPIPKFWFLLAKICAFTTIILLIPYGLNATIPVVIALPLYVNYIAFAIFLAGFVITVITSSALKKDLIFGLPRKEQHTLQTKGMYSLSRHPFYMGFLMVMFSSVLFIPNLINIACFALAWILHHIIMIREEQFLASKYGDEYRNYMQRVRRYF
jgi:protein-S-isoprenylcysteine O-methyltransferase Ste14